MPAFGPALGFLAVGAFLTFVPDHGAAMPTPEPAPAPPALVNADIPPEYQVAYAEYGGRYCPEIDEYVLAGIGKIETNHGRYAAAGVHSGANPWGAEGPMQLLGSTYQGLQRKYPQDIAGSVYDPATAVSAAAHYLCDGVAEHGSVYGAVYQYNHAGWYVSEVLAQADAYRFGQ